MLSHLKLENTALSKLIDNIKFNSILKKLNSVTLFCHSRIIKNEDSGKPHKLTQNDLTQKFLVTDSPIKALEMTCADGIWHLAKPTKHI